MKPTHAFAIPAYGHSPYLADCVASIRAQIEPCERIYLCTSTPSDALRELAAREGLIYRVNTQRQGIGRDWNFALEAAEADWVTLAHQDDLYDSRYVQRIRECLTLEPRASFAFTDFIEFDARGQRPVNINVRIKRLLARSAFRGRSAIHAPRDKRQLLRWGNPVCCPSVTLNRAAWPDFRFAEDWGINLDWDAWDRLSRLDAPIVWEPTPLVVHRVHDQSETTRGIADTRRLQEDRAMFGRYWSPVMAQLISRIYRASYAANRT